MDEKIIAIIKTLYNNDNLEESFQWLESVIAIDKDDLSSSLYDFKSEILDYLLILLSKISDIQDINKVYSKLQDIQAILSKVFDTQEEDSFFCDCE